MADMRKKRGLVFLLFSRIALLLLIAAPWAYPNLGPVNYCSLLVLAALIAWVGKRPPTHSQLDPGELFLYEAPVFLCVFTAEGSEKEIASYSSCQLIISDRRFLVLEKIAGTDVLLAQLRFPDDSSPEVLPVLRTWADFRITSLSHKSRTLSVEVLGDNEGSAHWGTTCVDLLFPEASYCYEQLKNVNGLTAAFRQGDGTVQ